MKKQVMSLVALLLALTTSIAQAQILHTPISVSYLERGNAWAAVHVMGRWAYAPPMPLIPLFNIGLTPVAQMLMLPPLIFRTVAMLHRGDARDRRGG